MAKREIVVIDEEKCNGCGLCVPECHEGALQIIDGKARLISDLFCDGLGACIGHCPEGALTVEMREAEAYDERKVMELMIPKGENTIRAHLRHLKEHGETEFLLEGVEVLREKGIEMDLSEFTGNEEELKGIVEELFGQPTGIPHSGGCGCPGSAERTIEPVTAVDSAVQETEIGTELRQWPVQLHLLNPQAGYFRNADVILTADCVAYAVGDFHRKYLRGNTIAIACPKLDSHQEMYVAKLVSMINDSKINTMTALRMQVPCCGGLVQMAKVAAGQSERKVPLKEIIIGIEGEVLSEQWI
ncbi:MAG: 4Fe-4S binding protein [Bacteroidales bacterium]